MEIVWLDNKEKDGIASLYSTSIMLNTVASIPFELAYRVQIGIDDNKNIVIRPISKDRVLRGDLDESTLQKISISKSYSRIASTSVMKKIGETLNISLSMTAIKYPTYWDESNSVLVIKCGGKSSC